MGLQMREALISGAFAFFVMCWFAVCEAQVGAANGSPPKLSTLFYGHSCPGLEQVVSSTMARYLGQDISSGAPLLRMFFHDCAVNGCDGSVLIASTPDNVAERDAVPNLTVRGYDIVDDIKSQLEAMCPGTVSCADIIALASRDAVVQAGGPMWTVELGRRDGCVSLADQASSLLPSSQSTAESLISQFAALGLTPRDMATLSGAHTFGRVHCAQIARRFFGFNSSTGFDPLLSENYAIRLRTMCPQPVDSTSRIPTEPFTPDQFDENYYTAVLQNQGILTSDSSLLINVKTGRYVTEYAGNRAVFFERFTAAMLKMGRVGVKLGTEGEIRRVCSAVN
ncbi:hypothetical protein M758_1G008700 [Ceratodon purpureus]|nr:hypothetical protein M758_1G008700 [Ceratodon purpureus]